MAELSLTSTAVADEGTIPRTLAPSKPADPI
jgi:hypothetical protein